MADASDIQYIPAPKSGSNAFVLILLVLVIIGMVILLVMLFYYIHKVETIKTDVTDLQTFQTDAQPKLDVITLDGNGDWVAQPKLDAIVLNVSGDEVGLQAPTGDTVMLRPPLTDNGSRYIQITNDNVAGTNIYSGVNVSLEFNNNTPYEFTPHVTATLVDQSRTVNLDNTVV